MNASITRRRFFQALAAGPALLGPAAAAAEPEPRPRADGEPLRVSAAAALKRLIRRVEPVYPPMARGMGVQGEVSLDAVIDTRGRVSDIERVEGHPVLGRAAADALSQWTFNPLTRQGEPATAVVRFDFSFKL